jgi:hypothetical protein
MLENTGESATPDNQEEIQVAEVMEQIRAGIRQRQAEVATLGDPRLGGQGARLRQRLSDLRAMGHIRERPFVSTKPVIGRFLVFVREMWNSVAAKWYVRPMLRQQNTFNQAVAEMIIDLQQRLDEMDQRAISADQDVTLLVRKLAEGEYRLRQWETQAVQERADLARRLSRLEEKSLSERPRSVEQDGD